MVVSDETLRASSDRDVKGKAVYVLHTWKDALWDMGPGRKAEPPAPREIEVAPAGEDDGASDAGDEEEANPAPVVTAVDGTMPEEGTREPASAPLEPAQPQGDAARELTPDGVYIVSSSLS